MRKYLLLAIPLALLLTGVPAQASTIQIGSAGALGANDFFDWGQFVDGALQGSPLNAGSNLGRGATLTDGGNFTALVEGNDWIGNFTLGNNVLYSGDTNNPFAAATSFTWVSGTPIAGLGLQITSNFYGAFTASLEVFNGATSLGLFSVGGVMDGNEDGTAPFLGALSDAVNINRAVFTLTSNQGAGTAGFGVNRLLTTDTPLRGTPVPEPATLSLVGMGALALIRRRRRQ
jgi:PEP-CTERM motif-containing protein